MITKQNTNTEISGNIFVNVFNSSRRIIESFSIDSTDNFLDEIIQRNLSDGEIFSYFINFEKRNYVYGVDLEGRKTKRFEIRDVNRKKNEILIQKSDDLTLSNYPLYVSSGIESEAVVHIDDLGDSYVLVLDDSVRDISVGSFINLYYVEYDTEIEEFLFNSTQGSRPRVILNNHTRENLVNYDAQRPQNNNEQTYGELQDSKFGVDDKFFNNFNDYINVDFSDYEDFVKYSSAYSKVIAFDNKMSSLKELRELKAKNTNNGGLQNINNQIEEIFDNLTPFEEYLYENKYKDVAEVTYNEWLEDEKVVAEDYDLENDEFLLRLFPPDIIQNDSTGYFNNFILLMGEFFDSLYFAVKSVTGMKETNFYSPNQIVTPAVKDALYDLGINNKIGFDRDSISDYFSGNDNLKKISDIISRRLLYSLPYLYKSKGTKRAIKELLNIFGISEDILSLYEMGGISRSEQIKVQDAQDLYWYMKKNTDETLFLDVTDADIDETNVTFEFMINEFNGAGTILNINENTKIDLITDGTDYGIEVLVSGSAIYQSSYFIEDNDNWTFISVSGDSGDNGAIFSYQQDNTGFGLVNAFSDTFAWTPQFGTYSNVELFEDMDISFTDFRIFNSVLTSDEIIGHAQDFQSVAEQDYPLSLLTRLKVYNPVDSYGSLSAVEGSATLTMTGIDATNFFKDTFYNFNEINYIFSESLNSEFIHIDTVIESSTTLSGARANVYKHDQIIDDENKESTIGLFLSPADILNQAIIRKAGDFIEYVPSEFDTNTYSFSNLVESEKYLDDVPDKIKNDYVYFSLYKSINDNIFTIIKQFIPASVNFEYGILLKNHILYKNRGYKQIKNGLCDLGYELNVDGRNTKVITYDSNLNLGTTPTSNDVIGGADSNRYGGTLITINESSDFNKADLMIDTAEIKVEYYSNNIIKGRDISDNEATILENAGASILVV